MPALLAVALCAAPSDDDTTVSRISRVENGLLLLNALSGEPVPLLRLPERMQHYRVPGVSIAVIHKGQVEWARGYGLVEVGRRQRVNAETVFQAASISKPVTAIGALRLLELGTLSLDKDVNTYLSAWHIPESEHARDQKVTLRRILSHNAGLSVHGFDGYARSERVPTLMQVLDGLSPANSRPVRVDLVPGTEFRYSGGAYTVLQLLISEVQQAAFDEVMRQLVIVPAGMIRSSFAQTPPPNAACGHAADGKLIPGCFQIYPELAAAGLWSTSSDLARLAIRLQMAARGAEGGLLTPAIIREMLKIHSGSYGLGFGIGGEGRSRFFVHPGGNAGFRAFMIAFTDVGSGAVVMTNSDNGMQLAHEILRGIASVYDWPRTGWSALEPVEKHWVAIAASELRHFAGKYNSNGIAARDVISVILAGDSLKIKLPGWPTARIAYASGTADFFFLDTAIELKFEVDKSGRATAVVVSENGQKKRAIRM